MSHYTRLADDFDRIWQFSPDYEDWMVEKIASGLSLQPNQTWVDFGAGTGRFTARLHALAPKLQTYCAEPDAAMCQQAAKRDGLRVIRADDQRFVTLMLQYDALLLKEVIHHLSDRQAFWQGIQHQLNADGRLLVVTRPQRSALALFEAAHDAFYRHQPSLTLLVAELEAAGFAVSVSEHTHSFTLSKVDWFAMLRSRFMSDLAAFSDNDIEAGIAELSHDYAGDAINMADTLLFLQCQKK
jgi:SAM-dependent methyltransferase